MPWTDSRGETISDITGWKTPARSSPDVFYIKRGSTAERSNSQPMGRTKTRAYYGIIRAGVAAALMRRRAS